MIDMYMALYLSMFMAFLSVDIGLWDGDGTTDDGTDTTDGGSGDGTDTTDGSGDDLLGRFYDEAAYSATRTGTAGDDSFTDLEEKNLAFFLNGGADTLDATDQADYASGGAGNDRIAMRAGADIVDGGAGSDTIDGGIGADSLFGAAGNDLIVGNGGTDSITGEVGDDTLLGGSGADVVFGGAGNDVLSGMGVGQANSRDAVTIDGVDSLDGGDGDDSLWLGAGDQAIGGAGNDTFQLDHTDDDLDGVITINDYTAGSDKIELHYTPQTDGSGNAVAPTLAVAASSDGRAGLISLNGKVVAQVNGASSLDPEAIRLVAAE